MRGALHPCPVYASAMLGSGVTLALPFVCYKIMCLINSWPWYVSPPISQEVLSHLA